MACEVCDGSLESKRKGARFCSDACRMKVATRRRRQATKSEQAEASCRYCDKSLAGKRAGAVYCSKSCSVSHKRQKRLNPLGDKPPTVEALFDIALTPIEARILTKADEPLAVGVTAGISPARHSFNVALYEHDAGRLASKALSTRVSLAWDRSVSDEERAAMHQATDKSVDRLEAYWGLEARKAKSWQRARAACDALNKVVQPAYRRLHNLGLIDIGHTEHKQRAAKRTALGDELVKRMHNQLADLASEAPDEVCNPLGDRPVVWTSIWIDGEKLKSCGETILPEKLQAAQRARAALKLMMR